MLRAGIVMEKPRAREWPRLVVHLQNDGHPNVRTTIRTAVTGGRMVDNASDMRRGAILAFASVLLLAISAACGQSGVQPEGTTKVTMSDFKFSPASISVPGGKVRLYLVNSGAGSHDMVITRDPGGTEVVAKSSLVGAGASSTFSVDNLTAGTYFFRCDVPGHADSGMTGSLTVT